MRSRSDRREKIILTASRLFMKNGVAEVRMQDICNEAQVDKSLLRYHFPTLDHLHVAVVEDVLAFRLEFTLRHMATSPDEPLARLRAYVESYFKWLTVEPGQAALFLYFFYLASFKPSFAALNRGLREKGRDRIQGMLYEAIVARAIVLPADKNAGRLAQQIQSCIVGGVVTGLTEGETEHESAFEQTWDAIQKIIAG